MAAVSMSTQAIDREPDASISAPRGLRLNTSEPRHGEIQPFDKGLDEAHRVLSANIDIGAYSKRAMIVWPATLAYTHPRPKIGVEDVQLGPLLHDKWTSGPRSASADSVVCLPNGVRRKLALGDGHNGKRVYH